jgi:cytochrome b561
MADQATPRTVYSAAARRFHWITAAFVVVMIPVGVVMSERGERNIWDATTNALYSSHKLAGFTLLLILIGRLIYRLVKGAPADEPTLAPWQKTVAHATHWALYALLFGMAISGWVGVSLYPALDIFGLFSLPAIVAPNEAAAETAFLVHKTLAFALIGLIALHVGATLHHHFIRKDGVLRRMLPKRP